MIGARRSSLRLLRHGSGTSRSCPGGSLRMPKGERGIIAPSSKGGRISLLRCHSTTSKKKPILGASSAGRKGAAAAPGTGSSTATAGSLPAENVGTSAMAGKPPPTPAGEGEEAAGGGAALGLIKFVLLGGVAVVGLGAYVLDANEKKFHNTKGLLDVPDIIRSQANFSAEERKEWLESRANRKSSMQAKAALEGEEEEWWESLPEPLEVFYLRPPAIFDGAGRTLSGVVDMLPALPKPPQQLKDFFKGKGTEGEGKGEGEGPPLPTGAGAASGGGGRGGGEEGQSSAEGSMMASGESSTEAPAAVASSSEGEGQGLSGEVATAVAEEVNNAGSSSDSSGGASVGGGGVVGEATWEAGGEEGANNGSAGAAAAAAAAAAVGDTAAATAAAGGGEGGGGGGGAGGGGVDMLGSATAAGEKALSGASVSASAMSGEAGMAVDGEGQAAVGEAMGMAMDGAAQGGLDREEKSARHAKEALSAGGSGSGSGSGSSSSSSSASNSDQGFGLQRIMTDNDDGNKQSEGGVTADGNKRAEGMVTATGDDVDEVDEARKLKLELLMRATDDQLVQSAALRKELELTLLRDLDELDEKGLRYRIIQLAAEMSERAKWEGVRLTESLRRSQEGTAARYGAIISEIRDKAKRSTAKALREQKEAITAAASSDFKGQASNMLEAQAKEYEEILAQKLKEQAAAHEQELNQRLTEVTVNTLEGAASESSSRSLELQALSDRVQAITNAMESRNDVERASSKVHQVTTASLVLENALRSTQPLGKQIKGLTQAARDSPLVTQVVGSISPSALVKGIPTENDLSLRFDVVYKQCYKAALVPADSPGMYGQIVGAVAAKLTVPKSGMVEGESALDALTRAKAYVDKKMMREAVQELEGLPPLPAEIAKDWVEDVKCRLRAEQAVKAIRAHNALLNAAHCS